MVYAGDKEQGGAVDVQPARVQRVEGGDRQLAYVEGEVLQRSVLPLPSPPSLIVFFPRRLPSSSSPSHVPFPLRLLPSSFSVGAVGLTLRMIL